MCILDGNAYDAKCLEAGQEREKDLDACSLFANNKGQPLLAPSGAASHNQEAKVVVHLAVSTKDPNQTGSPTNFLSPYYRYYHAFVLEVS